LFSSLIKQRAHDVHKDFDAAEGIFEEIRRIDPFRIDDIDVFSNILFVMDKRVKLSKLAHEFLQLSKDRPEVCCIVGMPSNPFNLITGNQTEFRQPL
jgi:hypothetical protein